MTGWTPAPELNELLETFNQQVQRVLGPELLALYLQGSFALGDADEGSDVDFLAVTRAPLTPAQRAALQAMHQRLFGLPSPWAQHLEGSYVPASLLRHGAPAGARVPYLDHGSRVLEDSDHDNSLVARWVTREHGTPLFGPPAPELIGPVGPEALKAEVRATLHRWGTALLADPAGLDNGWRQPYVALSVARMLHTLGTGSVHSKKASVAWAGRHLDRRWTPLLERAWEQHPRQSTRYGSRADPADLQLTRAFIAAALDLEPLQGAD